MDKKWLVVGTGIAAGCLTACGGSGNQGSTGMPSGPQSLDTQQVLEQAQKPSETATPYQVNDNALMLTDTSDTSEPLGLDAS